MVQCDVNQEKITIPETQRHGYLWYGDEDTGKSRDHEWEFSKGIRVGLYHYNWGLVTLVIIYGSDQSILNDDSEPGRCIAL